MLKADRLKELMKSANMSQAELARRVGLSQPTIYRMVHGHAYGSAHLHRIARALGTTPAYLTGETDDPDENAPPPPPQPTVQLVTMQVAMPSEPVLARMFEGLLRAMPDGADLDEQALLLARRLPIGLAQLRNLLPILPDLAFEEPTREAALATTDGSPR